MNTADIRETERIPHPFSAESHEERDGTVCSAFRVVGNHRGHIATGTSPEQSRHHRMVQSIYDQDTSARTGREFFQPNAVRSRPPGTHSDIINCNATQRMNRTDHLENDNRAHHSNAPCVSFHNGLVRTEGVGLRSDAIGPGVIFERPFIPQNNPSRNCLNQANKDFDKRLRRRGKRTNMSPDETTASGVATDACPHTDVNTQNGGVAESAGNGESSRSSGNGNVNSSTTRNRLSNNLELLSRPSWCDAKFAYDQVLQGKASGNKGALWFRSRVHSALFCLGCFVQRRAAYVLIPCLLVLAACAFGLKYGALETRVDKLWVESGGALEKELEYSSKSIGDGSGTTWQLLIQTGQDTATVESLKLHREAAIAATKVTVTEYDQTWELSDLCYKEVPDLGEISPIVEQFMLKLFPCFIMGPLDCFWEGSELLGPSTPLPAMNFEGIQLPAYTWKNLDPVAVVETLSSFGIPDVEPFQQLIEDAGVGQGYLHRWCLDPHNPDCPEEAPNKVNKEIPNVKAMFSRGCEGYATKFMKWPNDLIVGGIERNSGGNVTSSRGLQTLIQLMGPQNMYNFHKDTMKTSQIRWNLDKATNVLLMWQRKFVEEMYNIKANSSSFPSEPDTIHAFAQSTAADLILEFSNFSILRVAAGYLLMLVYACFTMLRCKASRSQGAVGVVGVVLVALSVMAGLGICSVVGIKFNAATTQVLPFLMLGLGVDDMFLIAHQFGEIACLTYIPFEERTGECIKRVGVSVLLTSIAILSGFLFSMIIPMPALQSFALQAAIITCFNLFCVLIVFPAALSIDLRRRKSNRLDVFCCFKSSSANDVVEFTDYNVEVTRPTPCDHASVPVRTTTLPAGPQATPLDGEATITMHHTIQAFSNESYVTFLGPAAETTFTTGNGNPNEPPAPNQLPQYYPPLTPPPRYTPDLSKATAVDPPEGPRQAFQEQGTSNAEPVITTNASQPTAAPHGTAARTIQNRPGGAAAKKNKNNKTSSNLVTPMVSVRSSTHSLVPSAGNKPSKWSCWLKEGSNRQKYNYICCLPFLTVSDFAKKYYGPFLMKTPVRIIILFLCAVLLGGSIYGCLQVRDGLDLVDVLPRDTREHDALSAQLKYFSFYNMHIVTQEFDYASKQRELHMLHRNLTDLKYVVRNSDGTKTQFWLEYFRDWLIGLQNAFDADWTEGWINESTWTPFASDEGVLAFKLLLQTGKFEQPLDMARIGCEPPFSGLCKKVDIVRLVSDDGIIREDGFYNYLSAWVQNDPLAYIASLAEIIPTPKRWVAQRNNNLEIPRSSTMNYTQMPYFLNGLRENDDFVDVIKSVRSLCDHYETEFGLYSYPSGYPFLFWQQYIALRQWLFIAMGAAIVGISLVVALVLLNPWAAAITCFFLIIITTELLGFMGLAGVKLSAVPAVILVAAIGLGVEFTVHITLAHITSCGSRIDRSKAAIAHMMGPVVDGAVSTFLGVVMLSGSEFDFIVRYFFQVLGVLVLIGLWNGIFVLPVVLSFIGPPPEVVPIGGGNRLKTPTPPPTPPVEEDDHDCHHNCNNNHIRRHTHHQRDCPMWHGYSSRDDVAYMQRGMYDHGAFHRGGRGCPSSRRLFDDRYHAGPAAFHPYDYHPDPRFQYQINPGYCHPHSVGTSGSSTPRAALDDGRVLIYPSADFVVYSPGDVRPMNSERVQHCEPSIRISTNNEPNRSGGGQPTGVIMSRRVEEDPSSSRKTTGESSSTAPSSEMGQHIATLTSSVTLKVRPSRYQQYAIYPPTSSTIGNPRSDGPSTIDVKFHPISHQPVTSFGSSARHANDGPPVPIYTEAANVLSPADGATTRNITTNSESSPVDAQGALNVDITSEAADSALQRMNNDDVTG